MPCESLINASQARRVLGGPDRPLSTGYITALKRAMGIRGRYFLASQARAWLRAHPQWCPAESRESLRQLLAECLPVVVKSGQADLAGRIENRLGMGADGK